MKKFLPSHFIIILFASALFYCGCNKNDLTEQKTDSPAKEATVDSTTKPSPTDTANSISAAPPTETPRGAILSTNKVEKLLSLLSDGSRESSNSNIGLRTTSYGCGSYLNGTYYGSGYYTYPDYSIDLSSTQNYSTINVNVTSYDVPNNFEVRDQSNNLIVSSGWMGYATYPGPWGMSLNTPQSKVISFNKGTINSYILRVQTVTQSYSDAWDASIGCALPPATVTVTYAGVSITYERAANILRFNSINDVNTVLNQLETDYETYNDNLLAELI